MLRKECPIWAAWTITLACQTGVEWKQPQTPLNINSAVFPEKECSLNEGECIC